jgi:hypothetical protein
MNNKYYVEVVAPDGLAHHIGPFAERSAAQAWIRQHVNGRDPLQNASVDVTEKFSGPTLGEERLV